MIFTVSHVCFDLFLCKVLLQRKRFLAHLDSISVLCHETQFPLIKIILCLLNSLK
jgi:hypothetical protein